MPPSLLPFDMVTPIEIGLVVLVLALLFGAWRVIKAIKPLIINTVVGLIILFAASFVGYGVSISPVVILLVAFGGVPAAVLVIILAQLGYIFEPALVLPLLL